jgi:hypothetical protein
LCATPPSTRATTSTIPRLAYPGRIPPFRRNEFGFTNGGPVYIPHLYDGRKRTFYFAQYQGFRQVLGTTQVMPVPTAANGLQRTGIDPTRHLPDGTTDTLNSRRIRAIAAILARYPLPNLPTGSFGANTYATASKVTTERRPVLVAHRPQVLSKDQFFARFNLDNLTGPTTNPDQTAIDPAFAVEYIDRQRNVVGTLTRTFTPHLTLESSSRITRSTPGFPTRIHRPRGQVQRRSLRSLQLRRRIGDAGLRQSLPGAARTSATPPPTHFKAGFEVSVNRDTTYFGISPERRVRLRRRYRLRRGSDPVRERQAQHQPGDPLPDTLSSFLSGSHLPTP